MEAFHCHGVNVVRFQLALGDRQWYIMECYFSPDDASTIEDVIAAIGKRPRGAALLVVGNFNTNLSAPKGRERDEGVAADLAEEGLEEMSGHLLPRKNTCLKEACTWSMHQGGQEVRSRMRAA